MRHSLPPRTAVCLAVLFCVLATPPIGLAQTSEPPPTQPSSTSPGQSNSQQGSNASGGTQQNEDQTRLFGIVPSHNIGYERSAKSLSSRDKFRIFYRNTVDPFPFVYVAIHAGISQAEDTHSGFGEGPEGYGKRYGASLADSTSARFFCVFLFPSLFKQDPRYLRKGDASLGYRLLYAATRPLIAHSDSGEAQFNISNITGKFAASGLANAYYPAENRGMGPTASRVGVGIAYQSLSDVGIEFWPEIHRIIRKL